MKRTRTILLILLVVTLCSVSFILAACGTISRPNQSDNGFNESDNGSNENEIVHQHSLIYHEATATCIDDGTIEHWTCSECNKNFSDAQGKNEINSTFAPALGHSYSEWTVLEFATCTQEGQKKRVCSRCGDVEIETILESEHNFNEDKKCMTCGYRKPTEGLQYQKIVGKEEYAVVGLGTAKDLAIVIPSEYMGLPVTEIGADAFLRSEITSIYIPNGIISIGEHAFVKCTRLQKVSIPDTIEHIATDRDSAFDYNVALIYNEKNNVYYLGNDENPYVVAMKAISQDVTSVTIDENCKLLYQGSSWGFRGCASIAEISFLGNKIKTIGEWAFSDCSSLTKVTLPEGITSIGHRAFNGCSNLTEITLPKRR